MPAMFALSDPLLRRPQMPGGHSKTFEKRTPPGLAVEIAGFTMRQGEAANIGGPFMPSPADQGYCHRQHKREGNVQ